MINCVLIRWLDGAKTNYSIVNMNAVLTSPNVVGLDPDLEYCVKRTPYTIPDYDPRLTNLVTTQNIGDFDSEYSNMHQWVITYSLQDRTAADKKISVDESESDANYSVFPTQKQLKYLTIAIALVDKKVSGLTLTTAQQSILNKLQDKALLIWQNHITANAKKALIDTELPVDLDSDWNTTDPEA
jgi:hypothetical protein